MREQVQRDRLGRRRRPSQNAGLRPMHPRLQPGQVSRSIRIAMSEVGWAALDRFVRSSRRLTAPRAVGELLENALGTVPDWQEFQIDKEKRLLQQAS